jgi:Sec-independent protein translocase protein TatA
MFGLTFEKLLLIGVIAVILIGPANLPRYASGLAKMVRGLRRLLDTAKERVRDEMHPSSTRWTGRASTRDSTTPARSFARPC